MSVINASCTELSGVGVSAFHTSGKHRSVVPGLEQQGRSVGTPTKKSGVIGAKTPWTYYIK